MIHVEVRGGLGNQMFEYAFARSIQAKTGQKICLHINYLDEDKVGTKRAFELNKFKLNSNISISYEKLPFLVDNFRNPIIKAFRGLSPRMCFKIFYQFGAYIWKENAYIDFEINNKKNYYLLGFWQSEKYFYDVKKIIIEEFTLKKLSSEFEKVKSDILSRKNAVCVHIRRGDFVGSNHEVCDTNYYNRCIEYFAKNNTSVNFVFFSDDVQWVKSMFGDMQNSYIVSEKVAGYEQLILMSLCKHYILSNSSFGWWAQYLNINKDKIVLVPPQWYINSMDRSIYQDDWMIMEKR